MPTLSQRVEGWSYTRDIHHTVQLMGERMISLLLKTQPLPVQLF